MVNVTLEIPLAALGIERDMKRDPIINRRYYMPREYVEGYFRDIAVFAVPSLPEGKTPWRIKDWRNKAAFGKMAHRFKPDDRNAPADQVIRLDQILDISGFMNDKGELQWEAPAENWTILRIGYQPTGRNNHPASYGGSTATRRPAAVRCEPRASIVVDLPTPGTPVIPTRWLPPDFGSNRSRSSWASSR